LIERGWLVSATGIHGSFPGFAVPLFAAAAAAGLTWNGAATVTITSTGMGELSDKQSRMHDNMEGITIGTRGWTRTTVCDSEMAARAGIPPEIQHKKYASERELRLDLEQRGLNDLRIILHKDGFAMWQEMPDDDHVRTVRKIKNRLNAWKNGRSIERDKNWNVYVNDSFNRPRNEKRCPHFVIYGPDRLIGQEIRTVNGKGMNPHVILQFSWGNNNIAEEACAVDDMMNFAGIGGESIHLGRLNVAYLIKALLRRGMMSRKSPL
jgi:hypothetical protein